uniref:Uncharacterized protein n=1 Tax=Rhizophagus irregularis (strain DAOM 181602 / DAOM 197198 / MUCL 43194) TaxID=747089 RepID=U9U746_RHIID
MSNMDDSPNLIKCSGCEKNISKGSKAMQHNKCWIYLDNNSGARVINYRKHKDALDVEKKIYVDDTSLYNRNVEFIDQFVDGEVSAINRLKEKWLSSQRKTFNFIQKGRNQLRIRELTRGIFNNELYKLCNSKQERQLLEEIWENCYLNIRSGIWLQRCEKANEIDKRKGVTKNDKKRKRLTSGIDEVETNTLDEERGKNNNNNHKKKSTKC